MTLTKKLTTAMFCSAILSANMVHADGKHEDKMTAPGGAVAATVNGKPISQMVADRVKQQLEANGQPADTKQILEELINLEVLTQAAENIELNKRDEVAAALHLQYTQTMANAYLGDFSSQLTIEEADIRAEFDKQIADIKGSELKASHILVEEESLAKDIIAQLNDGGDFATLAQEHSTGPTSTNGGDLGWFQPQNMVAEFSDAVSKLEKGETSAAPVKTQYGWHVIKLVDTRSAAKPDYSDAVKAGIRSTLLRERLAAHVDELRGEAKIETK